MAEDPKEGFDLNLLQQQLGAAQSIIEQNRNPGEAIRQSQIGQSQEEQEQEDPRNKENWDFGSLVAEGQSILSGGLQDTASSVATFPERAVDMFSGEMAAENKTEEGYRPEWDPFTDYDNPIETKTWWGKLLRGAVHFGSLAVGTVVAAKAAGITAPAWLSGLGGYSLIRAAGIGAVSDLISRESDGHNALGVLRDKYSWIDTPISTKDTDHPAWMKFKNIVEGMGIGLAFDGLSIALGKGSKTVMNQVRARNNSQKAQTIEEALAQVRREDAAVYRAAKNKPISEPHQGANISTDERAFQVRERLVRGRKEWLADDGSAGNFTTGAERERIAKNASLAPDLVEKTLKDLWSDSQYQAELEAVRSQGLSLAEVYGDAVTKHHEIINGRSPLDMSPEEYLKTAIERKDLINVGPEGSDADTIEILTTSNVITLDLTVATLLQQVRDLGIAGRELKDIVNLLEKDGPAKKIVDTILTALSLTKRARLVKSRNLSGLKAGVEDSVTQGRRYLDEVVASDMADTRESIASMLHLAGTDPDNNLLNAMFEAFSMIDNLHTLDDFDVWARKMIKGGEFKGRNRTGAAIRELEGVMVQSVLSGPKTPLRAVMGTSTATFMRPMATFIGASLRYPWEKDTATIRSGLASMNAMMEAIPESFELFKTRLNSYWSGEISTVKTRFSEYTKGDANWEVLRRWAEDSGRATVGETAAFRLANLARMANNSNWLTYSTKLMAATDDAFAYILGRAKMREKALRTAMDHVDEGRIPHITPGLMRKYEDDFYSQVFDADGNILDEATKFARQEVTLTQDLTGFAKGLNDVFGAHPLAKPFFLFARTGVNGLALTGKHTPGFNFLVKEFNDIARATPDNLGDVSKYGITNAVELANAKALQTGRLAIGSSLITMASFAYMNGNIRGNGPVDRQKRQTWIDGGWRAREIKIGDVWVNYDAIEPFNLILSTIADVGDYGQLMGDEWTEQWLLKTALVVGQGISSKSYLAGMQQFVDLLGGRPGQPERIVSSLINNQIPLSSLRNDLGKLITPYMRELGSGIDQSIRNRNLASEAIAGQPLPIKYDILNGKPIKDWDFMTRAFNMFSPISFNMDDSPGRSLLFNSGYDLRTSTYYGPDGTNLTDEPALRSAYQQAIGNQNLELQLNRLARSPKIIASIEEMNRDIANGDRGSYETKDYYHNRVIRDMFRRARQIAWSQLRLKPDFQRVIQAQLNAKLLRLEKTRSTTNQSILNMYK